MNRKENSQHDIGTVISCLEASIVPWGVIVMGMKSNLYEGGGGVHPLSPRGWTKIGYGDGRAPQGAQNTTKKSFCDGNNVDVSLLPALPHVKVQKNREPRLHRRVFLCDSWQIWWRKYEFMFCCGYTGILLLTKKCGTWILLLIYLLSGEENDVVSHHSDTVSRSPYGM
ncbi:hypothetical protein HNY73_020755 [Argiope bruennichi]|uniref:Uncharacterized protein n=1 Tax=Argiope bruennichi TaxID=94029 RepID=A0A8T0EBQ3_ARGBR|nr:hypothetical protein HNY73_020755 [Argiope bruennichi]